MTAALPYNLFFTGKEHPRDELVILGDIDATPICCQFSTKEQLTTVGFGTNGSQEPLADVAYFFWNSVKQPSVMHSYVQEHNQAQTRPMSSDLAQGSGEIQSRRFLYGNKWYDWKRYPNLDTYDLIDTQTASVIAEFRKERTHTAVGVVHAVLAFNFNDDTLLVKALVALCVNRWLDWTGS